MVPPPKIKVFVKEMVEPSSSVNMEASLLELERRGAKGGHLRPGKCVNCGREEMKSSRSMAKTFVDGDIVLLIQKGGTRISLSPDE